MEFTGIQIDPKKLKSKAEALKNLKENGADYQALQLISGEYFELFGNELVWHYPLCGTDFTGIHIIVVQEGFLCVPYDAVDAQDHELFEMDLAFMLDAGIAEFLLDEWKRYSEGLVGAMNDMLRIIRQN